MTLLEETISARREAVKNEHTNKLREIAAHIVKDGSYWTYDFPVAEMMKEEGFLVTEHKEFAPSYTVFLGNDGTAVDHVKHYRIALPKEEKA